MRKRNASRRFAKAGLFAFGQPTTLAERALLPLPARSFPWPPPSHPKLHVIGRRTHRIFAAEVVRRTRAGDSFEAVVLGAMRAAYPRCKKMRDETMRERGRLLANEDNVRIVVQSLLDERPS